MIFMKRFTATIVSTLFAIPFLSARTTTVITSADDSRIVYVGRTSVTDQGVSFDWSATYLRMVFEGNDLSVRFSDSRKDYINVWIDSDFSADADKVFAVASKDTLIRIAGPEDFKGSKVKRHTVIIQKRTEASQGRLTVHEVVTAGELLQAPAIADRLIEFVGDSYTCGYGTENSVSSDSYTPETQDPAKTYAAILARYFNADYMTISHSGQGIARNYNDSDRSRHMPDRYLYTFDESRDERWKADGSKPDVTVIYLGTNDFSTNRQPTRDTFRQSYIRLIREIKENYGENHPVLCVSSKADPVLSDYVREAVERCGFNNVYFEGLYNAVHMDTDVELGADWHPNYLGHKKIAHAMLPYVATVTGWSLEDKVIK